MKVKGHDPNNNWPLNTAADLLCVEAAARARHGGTPVDFRAQVPITGNGRPLTAPGPAASEEMLAFTVVKARPGWTDKAVTLLLGEPDELRRNPRYRGAAPARMYRLKRVFAVEATEQWREWLAHRAR